MQESDELLKMLCEQAQNQQDSENSSNCSA